MCIITLFFFGLHWLPLVVEHSLQLNVFSNRAKKKQQTYIKLLKCYRIHVNLFFKSHHFNVFSFIIVT